MNVFRELEEGTSVCPPTPQKLYFEGWRNKGKICCPARVDRDCLFALKGKKTDFPKKYTLLDNVGTVFPKASGFPVKGA